MSNDIKIWFCPADELLEKEIFDKYIQKISQYRRDKIEKYRFAKDKALSLAAGLMLSSALKSKGVMKENIEYIITEHGRPELKYNPEISFNISHSGNIAALIFSETQRVSVDIEQIKKSSEKVVNKFFSSYEQNIYYRKSEIKERDEFFYLCWTRREACGKLIGTGLDFSNMIVINAHDDDFLRSNGVYIRNIRLNPDYMVSAASDGMEIFDAQVVIWNSIKELDLEV